MATFCSLYNAILNKKHVLCCIIAFQSICLSIAQVKFVDAGSSGVICSGQTFQLNGSTNATPIQWLPVTGLTDPFSLNPIASPISTTVYSLNAMYLDVNLVVNGDFEQGNKAFTTQYKYDSVGLKNLQQEWYDVTTIPQNPKTFNWGWGACNDHTTGTGKMIIADGATTADTKIWCQTIAIKPNTDYLFGAWASNLIAQSPPNLKFTLNGVKISSSLSLPQNTCEWLASFGVWKSDAATTSVDFCVYDSNIDPLGNDFAMDDVFFGEYVKVTDEATVTVTNPIAPAVTNFSICQNAIAPDLSLSVSGSNLTWFNAAVGGVGTVVTPILNTTTTGSFNFWVTQTVNGCTSERVQLTVTVIAIPTIPSVINPVDRCENTTAPNLGTAVSGSNVKWYTVSVGGLGSVITPVASTSTSGVFDHWISQTVNGCEGARTQLTYKIIATPLIPSVTNPADRCENTISPNLGTAVSGSNIKWYTVSTGGLGSASTPVTSTSISGVFDHWVSQTVNGCEGARAQLTYKIIATPLIPTVTNPVDRCENSIAPNLGTAVSGSNIMWYTFSTGGLGSASTPVASTSTSGVFDHWVSQTVNGCESGRAQLTYEIIATPLIPTVTNPADRCENTIVPDLNLSVNGVNLTWYSTIVGGVGTNNTPIVNPQVAGVFDYWVSQTVSGCESGRAQLTYKIIASPSIPIVTPLYVLCEGGTIPTLTASGSGILTWYQVPNGGVGNNSVPIIDPSIIGIQNFWVSNSNGICTSPLAKIEVDIYPNPTLTSVVPNMICKGDTLYVELKFNGLNPFTLNYLNNSHQEQLITSKIDYSLKFLPNEDGTIIFEKVTDQFCTTLYANYIENYIVNDLPQVNLSAVDTICSGQTSSVLMSSNIPNAYFQWKNFTYNSFIDIGVNMSSSIEIKQVLMNTDIYPQIIKYEITALNNGCVGQTKSISIVVLPSYLPQLDENQLRVCTGTNIILDAGNAPFGYTFTWYKNNVLLNNEDSTTLNLIVTDSDVYEIVATNYCGQYESASTITYLLEPKHFGNLSLDSCINQLTSIQLIVPNEIKLTKWYILNEEFIAQVQIGESNIEYTFTDLNDYKIKIEGYANNCFLADTTVYFKGKDCSLGLVNMFTPNDDGANDNWYIKGIEYQPQASIVIFNRWGEIIKSYANQIPNLAWNGKSEQDEIMENGTYYYILDLKNSRKPIKGYVSILKE